VAEKGSQKVDTKKKSGKLETRLINLETEMYKLLVEELKQHEGHVAYIANKDNDGILHYYISKEFPMLGGFDSVITSKIHFLETKLSLSCGNPVAYVKLRLLFDGSIYMGVYFVDIGEQFVILDTTDFPKLQKGEGQE